MKLKIAIITLGHVDHKVSINKIKNWKSKLFEVNCVQKLEQIPESDIEDGFLDHKFSIAGLENSINCPKESDLAIAIMGYRFDDNFYLHRLSDNCVALSVYGIKEILNSESISIENFIIKQIYECFALKVLVKDFDSNDVYKIVHTDTRGCLFDLNGDRFDIIYNTEKPKICNACKNHFESKQLDERIFPTLTSELRKIKKPFILRVESFIRNYPFVSILLSGLFALFLNIVSNVIYDSLKEKHPIIAPRVPAQDHSSKQQKIGNKKI